MKAVLRGGALLQIIKESQIKNLLIQLKALERNKKQAQPKITWQREIIKIREEINKMEIKTEKIQKNQWNKDFFEKMNKISYLLAKWIQERIEKPNE